MQSKKDINDRLAWHIEKRAQWIARYENTLIVDRTKSGLMSKINKAIKEAKK